MDFRESLQVACNHIVLTDYAPRDGHVIPEPEKVALSDGAVRIDGAVLYADLAGSTSLIDNYRADFAADVIRVFLYSASRCIRRCGGSVTAFDGDRVMGVFIRDDYADRAARAAFALAACRTEVILPALSVRWDLNNTQWTFNYGAGIDTSEITVIRAGPPGDNDLIWLGSAANHAARLSALRDSSLFYRYTTYATRRFVDRLTVYRKYATGYDVWEPSLDGSYLRSSGYLLHLNSI